MPRTIAIYFDGSSALDAPLDDPMYLQSYAAFAAYAATRGDRVVVTRGASYRGTMTFSSGWDFDGESLMPLTDPVTVDLIYMKSLTPGFSAGPDDLVINRIDFGQQSNDKWSMYQTFGDLMAPSYQINVENWRDVLAHIRSDRVVLKPTRGSGGKGILIVQKEKLDFPSLDLHIPYIAQEFVDSSAGISGICTGYHDLRILMFNSEPKLAYLRLPQPGKLLSNVSQGASARPVPIEQISEEFFSMARRVDEQYQQYGTRHYSADFMMGPDRPYLVETNTQPGFPRPDAEGKDFQGKYFEYLWLLLDGALRGRHAQG